MTVYTLNGTPGSYYWQDPTSWVGGVVPNAPDADVVFPIVTMTSNGQPVGSQVNLYAPYSYSIRSLAVNSDLLYLGGTLAISGAMTLPSTGGVRVNGALSVGSLTSAGDIVTDSQSAQITSSGAVTNTGTIGTQRTDPNLFLPVGTSTVLTIQAASLSNSGSISGVLIETPTGGFANLNNGTISGGTFVDPALNVGATIVTDATNLSLLFDPAAMGYASGPADEEFDPTSGTYVPIESTLRTVTASGSLTVGGSYTTSNLTIDGMLTASQGTTFNAGQLTIDSGGMAALSGTLTGAVSDNGVLTIAPYGLHQLISNTSTYGLVIDGVVTGNGNLEIPTGTLELAAAASANVVFDDKTGMLILDQPGLFTGTIKPTGTGNVINLAGLSPSSIVSTSYAGNASGGTLTLAEGDGSTVNLRFVGSYAAASFTLSNGQTYSTSPPSLNITVVSSSPQTGNAFYVDGSGGAQVFQGTGNPNFINTTGAAGSGNVAVDLVAGTVIKGGQLDATFTNIQGVQLGADTSAILGLASGTDLLYGGTGTDTFNGNGATDYIQGGIGTNLIFGSTGNEIFYGNGGHDVMRGGSAANFMQGGSTASSTDVFYGTTGNDFVYGEGGAVYLVGGSGNEYLSGGSGGNELDDRQQQGPVGLSELVGSNGTDLFYGGIGTNLMYEGSGTDTFVGSSGTDYIYSGSGRSFTYAGSGTDVVTTGSGNDYVQAGSGSLYFNDTAANLVSGRYDQIDGFGGSRSTDLYLPTAVQAATSFSDQNGGTAIMTAVGGGTAELFVSNATVASVQAHTHFTL